MTHKMRVNTLLRTILYLSESTEISEEQRKVKEAAILVANILRSGRVSITDTELWWMMPVASSSIFARIISVAHWGLELFISRRMALAI